VNPLICSVVGIILLSGGYGSAKIVRTARIAVAMLSMRFRCLLRIRLPRRMMECSSAVNKAVSIRFSVVRQTLVYGVMLVSKYGFCIEDCAVNRWAGGI
jgi:hypothetical protein